MLRKPILVAACAAVIMLASACIGPTKEALTQPPCGSIGTIVRVSGCPSDGPALDPNQSRLTFCDLQREPDKFRDRLVRIRAVLRSDAGDHSIYDPTCSPKINGRYYEGFLLDFEQKYGVQTEAQTSVDKVLCKASTYFQDKILDVVLMGQLKNRYNRLYFVVSCVEQAIPKL